MTHTWFFQVSPRDDFADNAFVKESRRFATETLDAYGPNSDRFRSPARQDFQTSKGHERNAAGHTT